MNFLSKHILVLVAVVSSLLGGMVFVPAYSFGMEEEGAPASNRLKISSLYKGLKVDELSLFMQLQDRDEPLSNRLETIEGLLQDQKEKMCDLLNETFHSTSSISYVSETESKCCQQWIDLAEILITHGKPDQIKKVCEGLFALIQNKYIALVERIEAENILGGWADQAQNRYILDAFSLFLDDEKTSLEDRLAMSYTLVSRGRGKDKQKGCSILMEIIQNEGVPEEDRINGARTLVLQASIDLAQKQYLWEFLMDILKKRKFFSLEDGVGIGEILWDKGTPEQKSQVCDFFKNLLETKRSSFSPNDLEIIGCLFEDAEVAGEADLNEKDLILERRSN